MLNSILHNLGYGIIVIGVVLSVSSYFVVLGKVFLTSRLQGYLCILFPVLILLYLFIYWHEIIRPFLFLVLGCLLYVLGSFLIKI